MKRYLYFVLIVLVFSVFCSGCYNAGLFVSTNNTDVELAEPNYKIVSTNVTGESEAGYLFGFSFTAGAATHTMALARVSGSGMLYQQALENLWENYEAQFGAAAGKKLALVNVRYDSEVLNLIVYSKIKISIRADIVEFSE